MNPKLLADVINTYQCLISICEKMPGTKMENAFNREALKMVKEEYLQLKALEAEAEEKHE